MGELRMARASLHVKRHLSVRELATIAAALAHFRDTVTYEQAIVEFGSDFACEDPLSPDDINALRLDLLLARKVQICRSKTDAPEEAHRT